jgi:LysR family hydrogen peroxide-inducible transcriptional activator
MVTLKQLRYLSALARHGHFGRAAESCAITQPALSMQIRDLEQFLGVTLVERRPGEVIADRDRPGNFPSWRGRAGVGARSR